MVVMDYEGMIVTAWRGWGICMAFVSFWLLECWMIGHLYHGSVMFECICGYTFASFVRVFGRS